MTSFARGTFPGRPRKKIQKQRVKYQSKLRKYEPEDLKLTCLYINSVIQQFHDIFDDDHDQDAEFIGFSSEECGLRAYKRVSKKAATSMAVQSDILRSNQSHHEKDKVTTRRSFALDHNLCPNHTSEKSSSAILNSDDASKKNILNYSKDNDAYSSGSSDSAFLKYKDFKLDFHRLSKKAKSKDTYNDFSAEEQARRKDTSTASLKYKSDIYLAKHHATLGVTKSPIKPATFIPPPITQPMHVLSTGETSLRIKRGHKQKNESQDQKKGAGHPEILAKALLARANKCKKAGSNGDDTNAANSREKPLKSSRGFVLPSKSARSARIIKANRKYMDEDALKEANKQAASVSQQLDKVNGLSDSSYNSSVSIPQHSDQNKIDKTISNVDTQSKQEDLTSKRHRRRPLIKEPTFCIKSGQSSNLSALNSFHSSESGLVATEAQMRARRLIKRARFKHPTSSDALVLGADYTRKAKLKRSTNNPIRQATFTAPTLKKKDEASSKNKPNTISSLTDLPTKLGLAESEWIRVCDNNNKLWIVGGVSRIIPNWTTQEIHNLLHGAHTFGASWSSIARHYEFHQLHRDWLSITNRAKKCRQVGLLNDSYKVKSSILLQLKPKLSSDPNVTVFTPNELNVRGLKHNVSCDLGNNRKRCPARKAKEWIKENDGATAESEINPNSRIFGTGLSDPPPEASEASEPCVHKMVKYQDIDLDDLYLGLSISSFTRMLQPREQAKMRVAFQVWEIHNILHGVHYFGIGSWTKIMKMYQFVDGHNNISIRGRFKSVCYRGLIVAGDVRDDILPRLHVVLTERGKNYFIKHNISLLVCVLPKLENDASAPDTGRALSIKKRKRKRRSRRQAVLEDTSNKNRSDNVVDSDDMAISPPRRAYHLFGAVPVWDEATKPELIDSEAVTATTPVLEALEDGLRRNKTPPQITPPTKLNSSDVASPSPLRHNVSNTSSPALTNVVKNVTVKPCDNLVKRNKTDSSTKTKMQQNAKKSGKGPRIKHVCRRASLVTGQTRATVEDHAPHLTALPKDEREKIAAEAEKYKVNLPDLTSSESESDKVRHKATNHTTARREKQSRKRNVTHRCGVCETCMAPPCDKCDACREKSDVGATTAMKSPDCTGRKDCLNPTHITPHPKRARKVLPDQQPASRKSSRLQQQRIPLKSAPISESSNFATATSVNNEYRSTYDDDSVNKTTSSAVSDLHSPSTDTTSFEALTSQKQALVKVDNWKEVYDLDLLWKSAGHALITSHPAPPQAVCLLCGSHGLQNEPAQKLVYCAYCCEPFHQYCADDKYSQPNVAKAMGDEAWICRRCQYCRVCGGADNLLECRYCRRTYHSNCLGSSYPTKTSTNGVWVCMQCVRCKSCGASKPGSLPGSKWTHDYTMCQRCGGLYDKGNFCPICQKCYSDEDYECRMIQCAACKRWIHSKCENLSVEMYTLLSHMPDSVQYKCPECDGRAAKIQHRFDQERAQNGDGNRNSPDAEHVRSCLSKLPAPPWRKMLKKEVQSGLESIIMALFHNRATYCVLKKYENTAELNSSDSAISDVEAARPRDLFAVRFAVHNRRYQSIETFCGDVLSILESVSDASDQAAVAKTFKEEAGNVFPWFNFETGKVRDVNDVLEDLLPNATMPPLPEHNYAQWQDKDITVAPSTPNPSPVKSRYENISSYSVSSIPVKKPEDLRQCMFCSKYDDDKSMNSGRLLYCGQDEWCHVNCALWSAEVYEQHDGSLENVHSAASRGKMMKCDHCRLPGATVGCNTRDCPKNYHFMCARLCGCGFHEDKKVFCVRHLHHAKSDLLTDEDFHVERLVCVDNDEMRPNRRWQRGMLASNVTVTIGSLTVHQLGRLGRASDSKDYLIPISYSVSRIFWSTFHATRKTVYTITISEAKPVSRNVECSTDNTNLTICHCQENDAPSHLKRSDPVGSKSNASPPLVCRTNLMKRMEEDAHIGPLSPTRRSGFCSPTHKRSSTYTIISGINKTLPQAVTPYPATPVTTVACEAKTSLIEKNSVIISPENPFLNKTDILIGSRVTSSLSPPSSTSVDKPVFSDLVLPKNNVSSTVNTSSSALKLSDPSVKSVNTSQKKETSPPPVFVKQAAFENVPGNSDADLKSGSSGCLVTSKAGSSGCLVTSKAGSSACLVTSKAGSSHKAKTNDLDADTTPSVRTSAEKKKESQVVTSPKDLNKQQLVGVIGGKTDKITSLEENTSTLSSHSSTLPELHHTTNNATKLLSGNSNKLKSTQNLNNKLKATNTTDSASSSSQDPDLLPVLIKSAREAASVESQSLKITQTTESPLLWWKKGKSKSKGKKSMSDEDGNFHKKSSTKIRRSSGDNFLYKLPPNEKPHWKKQRDKTSLETTECIPQKRSLKKRSCKANKSNYKLYYSDSDAFDSSSDDFIPEVDSELMETTSSSRRLDRKSSASVRRRRGRCSAQKNENKKVDDCEKFQHQKESKGKSKNREISNKKVDSFSNNSTSQEISAKQATRSTTRSGNISINCPSHTDQVENLKGNNCLNGESVEKVTEKSPTKSGSQQISATSRQSCNTSDTNNTCNYVNNFPSSETSVLSLAASDEECSVSSASPSKKLRKFAVKSKSESSKDATHTSRLPNQKPSSVSQPQPSQTESSVRVTRLRSKSEDCNEPKKRIPSLPGLLSLNEDSFRTPTRKTTLAARLRFKKESEDADRSTVDDISVKPSSPEASTAPESTEGDSLVTSRRYPRRNTYTCLKSFSGLSPNYALASYSRTEKSDKNKKHKSLSARNKPSAASISSKSIKIELHRVQSDFNGEVKKKHPSKDDVTSQTTVNSEGTDHNKSDKPEVPSESILPGVASNIEEPSVATESCDGQHVKNSKMAENKVDVALTSSPDADIQVEEKRHEGGDMISEVAEIFNDESIKDFTDEEVSSMVNSQHVVKALLDDVLDSLDVSAVSSDNEKKSSSVSQDVEFSPNKDFNCDLTSEVAKTPTLDDSTEELRGGGQDNETMSGLDKSTNSTLPDCSHDETTIVPPALNDSESLVSDAISQIDMNPLMNTIENPCDVFNSISPIRNDNMIEPQIVTSTDPASFDFSGTDCPVLSADEVKTLLDGPETPPQSIPTLNSAPTSVASQQQPAALSGPVMHSRVGVPQLPNTPALLPPSYNSVPENQYVTPQIPLLHPHTAKPPTMFYPSYQVPSLCTGRSTPRGFASRTNIVRVAPVPYLPPLADISFLPDSGYSVQQQHDSAEFSTLANQSACPVPYSLRVTMAMASAINSAEAVQSSFGPPPMLNPKQQFPSSLRCRSRPTGLVRLRTRPYHKSQKHNVAQGRAMNSPRLPTPLHRHLVTANAQPVDQVEIPAMSDINVDTSSITTSLPTRVEATTGKFSSQSAQLQSLKRSSTFSSKYMSNTITPLTQRPTNKVMTPSTNQVAKTDLSAASKPGHLASLEHLIDYYSTKNNLTTEEKAIVRSIISSQIQSNKLPTAAISAPPPKSKAGTVSKKRLSSVDSSKSGSSAKTKVKRKEKNILKHDFDEPWSVFSDFSIDRPSPLVDIYLKRKQHRSSAKMLSSCNIFLGEKKHPSKENRLPPPPSKSEDLKQNPHLVYEIKSDDGYYSKGECLEDLITQLLSSVQECRSVVKGCNPTMVLHSVMAPHAFLGVSHDAVRFLVEQLPGARRCPRYRAKYYKHKKTKEEITHINPHGCCRAEQYKGRSKPDMFSFLASKHRLPPEFQPEKHQTDDMVQLSNRRATTLEDLPMAMRFRQLRSLPKDKVVGVYRSPIHGRGLFCKRDLEAGEMFMEYTGQIIRKELTDKREKMYESKSIGCYMFRMDDMYVVDATLLGSATRFINHSCEPNCYSRIIYVDGKKHIVIFALRRIYRGEELTYDYKFPIEDEMHKIACNCGARNCRKYMN